MLSAHPAERVTLCSVCGLKSSSFKHYGVSACNSCASFFRRTISNGLAYQCTCRLTFRRKKKGCRHCRFERCLRAGMDAIEVTCTKTLQRDTDSLLSTVAACRNKTYAIRGLLLREIDACNGASQRATLKLELEKESAISGVFRQPRWKGLTPPYVTQNTAC